LTDVAIKSESPGQCDSRRPDSPKYTRFPVAPAGHTGNNSDGDLDQAQVVQRIAQRIGRRRISGHIHEHWHISFVEFYLHIVEEILNLAEEVSKKNWPGKLLYK
jgi:hypothetical protein